MPILEVSQAHVFGGEVRATFDTLWCLRRVQVEPEPLECIEAEVFDFGQETVV